MELENKRTTRTPSKGDVCWVRLGAYERMCKQSEENGNRVGIFKKKKNDLNLFLLLLSTVLPGFQWIEGFAASARNRINL